MAAIRFHPGAGSPPNIPLSRFFPQISQGAVTSWLSEHAPEGSLLIDPYGTSPQMLMEVASAGYRVISILKNPITRFVVEILSSAPQQSDMKTAVADLASTKRGDIRLEPYLLSIYETKCGACDSKVSADAFLWDQNTDTPFAKRYTCQYCGQHGEYPTNEEDIQLASEFTSSGQNYYKALDRVTKPGSPIRTKVETILDHFSNRAIHAVFTIINRIESMGLSEHKTDLLEALTLSALDSANKLWPIKELDKRPLRVYTPGQYLEANIWKAMEESISVWTAYKKPIEICAWPQLPSDEGGICVFSGKMSTLIDSPISREISAAVTIFPRLNPAYWSFAALWAGWLWSKKTSQTFVNILGNRRFDWAWHCSALTDTNKLLSRILPEKTKYFGIIAENNSQFNNAVVLAGKLGGFDLISTSPRPEEEQIQITWQNGNAEATAYDDRPPVQIINLTAKKHLRRIEEPSSYTHLQFAVLSNLVQTLCADQFGKSNQEKFQQLETSLKVGLSAQTGILRFGGTDRNPEEGKHWIDEQHYSESPLSDQIEQTIINELILGNEIDFEELEIKVCEQFPGILTPSKTYIEKVLQSYANQTQEEKWVIRSEDLSNNRDADIEMILDLIRSIGTKTGYQLQEDKSLYWRDKFGTRYRFYVLPSAMISPILTLPTNEDYQKLIVLPGSRTELVMTKLEMDPRLKREMVKGWRFLKFRQVRFMSLAQSIIPDNIDQFFNEDPLEETDTQLSLL